MNLVSVWREGKTKSGGSTDEYSSSRFLMTPWSAAETLQLGARAASSWARGPPSAESRGSGCTDGYREGKADEALDAPPRRAQSPRLCSASSEAGRNWGAPPRSSRNRL